MDTQNRKLVWSKWGLGGLIGTLGAFVGQLSGVMANKAIDGGLGEWGEGPALLGLVVRTILEILGPSVGSTLGIYRAGIEKGDIIPIQRLGKTCLGCISGGIAGWFVSYPFGPIFWFLLPPFLSAGVGTAVDLGGQHRPLHATIISTILVGLSSTLLVWFLWP